MVIYPCFRCRHRGNCDLEAAQRAALRAVPVRPSLARFRCEKHRGEYVPGTVVDVVLPAIEADSYGSEIVIDRGVLATGVVMEWAGRKRPGMLRLWVEDEDVRRRVLHAWPDRCRPTGFRVEVCETCARPLTAPPPVDPTTGEPDDAGHFCACAMEGRHVAAAEAAELARRERGFPW